MKTTAAAAKTMNRQYHIYSDEFSDEKCRDSQECLFIYIILISCFGLLKQRPWLWTTKTILILIVYTPAVFSKPNKFGMLRYFPANSVNFLWNTFYIMP